MMRCEKARAKARASRYATIVAGENICSGGVPVRTGPRIRQVAKYARIAEARDITRPDALAQVVASTIPQRANGPRAKARQVARTI